MRLASLVKGYLLPTQGNPSVIFLFGLKLRQLRGHACLNAGCRIQTPLKTGDVMSVDESKIGVFDVDPFLQFALPKQSLFPKINLWGFRWLKFAPS